MKIKFLFAWYDFWIGFFWDAKKHALYIFPLPMFGVRITIWGRRSYVLCKHGLFYRPNDAGYTNKIREAGHYTYSEAKAREYQHDVPVTMHHIERFL